MKTLKTTIDNTQRKFYVAQFGWGTDSYVCNLKDIPKVIKHMKDEEQYKIYHIWNHQIKPISKKELNDMFAANQIKYKI